MEMISNEKYKIFEVISEVDGIFITFEAGSQDRISFLKMIRKTLPKKNFTEVNIDKIKSLGDCKSEYLKITKVRCMHMPKEG